VVTLQTVNEIMTPYYSPIPITLPSAVSELFSGISSMSISVLRQNVWSAL